MPVSSAARALEVLLALSMLLQTLEYLRMRQALTVQGLWAWPVQRADIPPGPVQNLLDTLFADRAMHWHLLLRLPVLSGTPSQSIAGVPMTGRPSEAGASRDPVVSSKALPERMTSALRVPELRRRGAGCSSCASTK